MNNAQFSASVPVFKQMLKALAAILATADAHAQAKNIEPAALLQARLFPNMFALVRQVQVATEFARGVTARLANVDVPVFEATETSFADLLALIAKTLTFLEGVDATQMLGSESREVVLRPGTPKERKLVGQVYLLQYGLPQFFFHVASAYAILRHNGIEIGKRDYMGDY